MKSRMKRRVHPLALLGILAAASLALPACLDFGGGPVQQPDAEVIDTVTEGEGATDPAPDGETDTTPDPVEDIPFDETPPDLNPTDPPREDTDGDTPPDLAEDVPPDFPPDPPTDDGEITPPTEDCGNGVDDDGDGYVDCNDDDCLDAGDCEGICRPVRTVSCGTEVWASNDDWGSTDRILVAECLDYDEYTGPEIAYELEIPELGKVYIGLEDFYDDLDIFLLDSDYDVCDTSDCISASTEGEGYDEYMDVDLDAGTYYILIDGFQDTVSDFYLWIYCTDLEDCGNGYDDDEDGDIDCMDNDCLEAAGCEGICYPLWTLDCGEEVWMDNLDWGSTDRIDLIGCTGTSDSTGPEIAYGFWHDAYEKVYMGLEDFSGNLDFYLLDSNGDLCETSSCIETSDEDAGIDEFIDVNLDEGYYYVLIDGRADTVSDFYLWTYCTDIEVCDNGYDDDEDGDTDCADPECTGSPSCP
jgi:hypothetical protein